MHPQTQKIFFTSAKVSSRRHVALVSRRRIIIIKRRTLGEIRLRDKATFAPVYFITIAQWYKPIGGKDILIISQIQH